MPESVTLSWDEWEQMEQEAEDAGDVLRWASNWDIAVRKDGDVEYAAAELQRAVRKHRRNPNLDAESLLVRARERGD